MVIFAQRRYFSDDLTAAAHAQADFFAIILGKNTHGSGLNDEHSVTAVLMIKNGIAKLKIARLSLLGQLPQLARLECREKFATGQHLNEIVKAHTKELLYGVPQYGLATIPHKPFYLHRAP